MIPLGEEVRRKIGGDDGASATSIRSPANRASAELANIGDRDVAGLVRTMLDVPNYQSGARGVHLFHDMRGGSF